MENLLLYTTLFTLIGIATGLFILNFFLKNRFKVKIDLLNQSIKEKEKCLIDLESECAMKKEKLDKIVLDSIVCKSQLLETSNSLRKKADEVYRAEEELSNIKEKISHIEKIENRNRELLREVSKLKQEVGNGGKDSKLADEIERLKKIIEERDRKIEAMKEKDKMEELEYYKITKDQFQQIEKILKEYKEKIDVLERENSRLKLATNSNIDNNILDKINSSFIKFSDVTSSSFFKDNYVKISKA